MPLYDYDCAACGRRVEVVHGVFAAGPAHCPNCGGGPLRKAIAAPAVHFKGSGWAKKERRAAAKSTTSDASSGGSDDGKEAAKPGESSAAATDDAASTKKGGTAAVTTSD